MPAFQAGMVVPACMRDQNEPDSTFHQAACHQTVLRESSRWLFVSAVGFECRRAFVCEVEQFRTRSLHPEREFVRGDAGCDFLVTGLRLTEVVECANQVNASSLRLGSNAV